MTYVTERNLQPDLTGEPVSHPALDQFFDEMHEGIYVRHGGAH
jgi:heat shock protein HspQ